jgi:hypothetical protein
MRIDEIRQDIENKRPDDILIIEKPYTGTDLLRVSKADLHWLLAMVEAAVKVILTRDNDHCTAVDPTDCPDSKTCAGCVLEALAQQAKEGKQDE